MLLQAIQDADFETYVKLTDSSITCFEPEAVSFNRPTLNRLNLNRPSLNRLRRPDKSILTRLHSQN